MMSPCGMTAEIIKPSIENKIHLLLPTSKQQRAECVKATSKLTLLKQAYINGKKIPKEMSTREKHKRDDSVHVYPIPDTEILPITIKKETKACLHKKRRYHEIVCFHYALCLYTFIKLNAVAFRNFSFSNHSRFCSQYICQFQSDPSPYSKYTNMLLCRSYLKLIFKP